MTSPRNLRSFDYSILDVFAERPLEGNPLAVFHDARGLSDAEMQALARETHLAETTFVLPGDPGQECSQGVRVRIFTTEEELPFAGHPTLGTASWLYFHHPLLKDAEVIRLRLNAGPIEVRFHPPTAGEAGVQGTMRQQDPVFGATHNREQVARAIGLQTEDLSHVHAPQTVSTGLPFCIVPLRSLEVAQRLQIGQREAQAWLSTSDAKFFYCVAPVENATAAGPSSAEAAPGDAGRPGSQGCDHPSSGSSAAAAEPGKTVVEHGSLTATGAGEAPTWHARMQFYNGEDPATGSAAGCFISWLVSRGIAAAGQPVVVEQGVEIQRPSRILAAASLREGRVVSVVVSGRTIPVAAGRFFLP
jgi:trans-2,3-dihydro-3-hydroxyanthranilate isomerase